ncbi:MAG: hypothetical protein EOP83_33195 [Verrucomicrobiaceae bacterium]|nr:MAG: hypothetical protein EOP83_33195 [Verrucomicrobiaceae bacterium]
MRLLLLALLTIGMVSCDKHAAEDRQAALVWSKKPEVTTRSKAATWAFQKEDKSWVSISTARCTETGTGLLYDGGEILRTGFIVYPGATQVATMEEALVAASKLKGATYKLEGAR